MFNPLWVIALWLTGKSYGFSELEKTSDINSYEVRSALLDYTRKRRSGEAKSDLDDNSDVLSQMLTAPEIYSDEDVVDEILDFLVAGTQTT
mmetsp:Transcript_592/g.773  ORF Transcript_592/g.773 Transcript_592/m.773 type:complete len:91 (-) Transcript_592:709-981(-)